MNMYPVKGSFIQNCYDTDIWILVLGMNYRKENENESGLNLNVKDVNVNVVDVYRRIELGMNIEEDIWK